MNLNTYTYSFPFKEPFRTSAKTFTERKGLILELKDEKITALGEAAPLPGFSPESLKDVFDQWKGVSGEISNLFADGLLLDSLQVFRRKNNLYPSLQFALDTLAVDYLSQKSQVTAQEFLFDEYAEKLQINGILPLLDNENTSDKISQLIEQGYSTVKVKIGRNFDYELEELRKIRSAYPDLVLRLDANQAWSTEEAIENLTQLESLHIEYCEEPLAEVSVRNYRELGNHVEVPLALDESLTEIRDWNSVMPHIAAVIIKPMVLGGLSKLFATNRLANNHGNKVIYTTSLESGIGRTMTVILAAGLGNRDSAHGLSTGSLLTMDVWNDGTYINNGSVNLPDRSELGKRYHSNHKYLEPIE
ncbi:MAG: o-succinylbenzoate synthase [Balneolaceae bacterium]|nr:o-succinylbenzoate synthase [Balneolaceae bacterium]